MDRLSRESLMIHLVDGYAREISRIGIPGGAFRTAKNPSNVSDEDGRRRGRARTGAREKGKSIGAGMGQIDLSGLFILRVRRYLWRRTIQSIGVSRILDAPLRGQ